MSVRQNILFKLSLIYLLLILAGLLIIGKIIYLQFFYDREYIESFTSITTKYSEIKPNRGDIYSSDGKLLATSVPYYKVGIDPNTDGLTQRLFDENIDSLCYYLSRMFPHKSKQDFKSDLIRHRDAGSRYYRLSRDLDYQRFQEIQDFPLLRLGRFTGGFVWTKHYKRERPFGNLCRRTIGVYENPSRRGIGLEKGFDQYLKGVVGYTVKQRIAGSMWMPISDFNHVEPKDGYDLISTVDISIQDIAETALKRRLMHHKASFGTVVVMEVETGKVRAIVNLTRYGDGLYIEDYNYAVGRKIDPGSTFKLATIIAALEDGYIEPTHLVETGDGTYDYFGTIMEDTQEGGHGTISIQKAFEVSSNVGISRIVDEYYSEQPEKFIDRLYKLNLNEPLGIVISGEPKPTIPYPHVGDWSLISITQISIGYEVELTPLQILAFYNAIANNGRLVRPIFAERLLYRGNTVKEFQPEIINPSICSRQSLAKARLLLKGVVKNGTARNIKSDNFSIAGKTGTAQMNYGIKNAKREYHASFAGYFPAEDPKYSMIVSVFEPQRRGYYGSVVAAPVFKEIAEKIYASNPGFFKDPKTIDSNNVRPPIARKANINSLKYVNNWFDIESNILNISNANWVSGAYNDSIPKYSPLHYSDRQTIPNLINMKLSDALLILENLGLEVNVNGRGRIVRQSPRPGSNFSKNTVVELTLNI